MTDAEMMMAVARLANVEVYKNGDSFTLGPGGANYLASRDAVITVVLYVCNTFELEVKFEYALWDVLKADGANTEDHGWTWLVVKSTPRQLCRALLKTMNQL